MTYAKNKQTQTTSLLVFLFKNGNKDIITQFRELLGGSNEIIFMGLPQGLAQF